MSLGGRPRPSALPYRLALGAAAGLLGGAVVEVAGRLGERAGRPRRPTLPARVVAKSLRLPPANRVAQGPVQHTAAMVTGLQDATGTDPRRVEQAGQLAHYTWSAAWGAARGVMATGRRSRFSAALLHGLAFAATDHVVLASTRVGAPIWGQHDDDPTEAAIQAGQLLLYSLTTSLTYQHFDPTTDAVTRPRAR